VSLGVVASAIVVALGAPIADPIVGLAITLVILKITWDSWRTVRRAEIDLEHVGRHGRAVAARFAGFIPCGRRLAKGAR
jgi:Co/Zn/Cd efflux system component